MLYTDSNPQQHAYKVGSLLFCPTCGNLLDQITSQMSISCNCCQSVFAPPSGYTVVTKSRPNTFVSALKSKRELVQTNVASQEASATIDEKCPKCGAPEMSFHTMQLRSADEGQTVFYSCVKCGYKYSINS
ncbi:RNA polymerase I subunit A12.2 [Conidiobolus coronatus NRRL 28638]|jgi:DNA-directed RNA polymerase I subunit RPA12|uniref:DNA-directed RNA polymerase subunit n=1 Tax=Conidiobolus coronatus (strain ATCC 28846 / CBS 209.66 / NRRL 28638) TaxID=796925 RepID=A0A137P2D5_CONC2|nr:RNA polymerase I subunit A12.2 [Conidiobolus coronatus NRRL 28638]|eukprot:KXN69118.1 RNA polymerase I subunit A12.2 [Conidiobolus coronatus NRRL 28638]